MIRYYGEDEDALMRPRGTLDPMAKVKNLAPLPLYLDGRASLFGYNIDKRGGKRDRKRHL